MTRGWREMTCWVDAVVLGGLGGSSEGGDGGGGEGPTFAVGLELCTWISALQGG